MLSAFFRDVAHKMTMLGLLHERDQIQKEARDELRDKFRAFDIECVDVLIGKPVHAPGDDKIETLLELLRQRMLAGRGESQKIMQIGLSEAAVLLRKIGSFGDPRLYALQEVAAKLANSSQPLVPERLFVSGSQSGEGSTLGSGMLETVVGRRIARRLQKTSLEMVGALGSAR